MAKRTGIGSLGLIGGNDLSGDIHSLDKISGGPKVIDLTAINAVAFERTGGRRDGELSFIAFYNPAAGQAHPVLSALPTTDVLATYCMGTTLGDPAAFIIGKQVNYDPKQGADGSLLFNVQVMGNGNALEWGRQLTAGKVTVASAAAQAVVDFGTSYFAPVTITSNTNASPTVFTAAAAHGLYVGASVVIAGVSDAGVNGSWVVASVPTSVTFTLTGVNSTGGTGGTVTLTSTNYGGSSALQVMSLASGTVTPVVQHSADNGVADAWATITGLAHTAVTGQTAERLETTNALIIKRYVRFNCTNTFSNAVLAAAFCRYLSTP